MEEECECDDDDDDDDVGRCHEAVIRCSMSFPASSENRGREKEAAEAVLRMAGDAARRRGRWRIVTSMIIRGGWQR